MTVEISFGCLIAGGIVVVGFHLAQRQLSLNAAAALIEGETGAVTIRVGLADTIAQFVIRKAGGLVQCVRHGGHASERVITEAGYLTLLICAGDLPAQTVID